MSPRDELAQEIRLRLGAGMVDVELDPEHIDLAITYAFRRYRQRSANAMEETFVFLDVQPDVSVYTLPHEVQEVQSIYRRTMSGTMSGAGGQIDPFSMAFANNLYMINNPGGLQSGGSGSLATYDFSMQHQELVGRMFGRDLQFSWNASTKRLTLHRRIHSVEQVALHCWTQQPETVLLTDPYARPWLTDYAVAQAKLILGEARAKFQSLAGPQGGVSLNGDSLKSEAQAELDRLDQELKDTVDGHQGYGFIIG